MTNITYWWASQEQLKNFVINPPTNTKSQATPLLTTQKWKVGVDEESKVMQNNKFDTYTAGWTGFEFSPIKPEIIRTKEFRETQDIPWVKEAIAKKEQEYLNNIDKKYMSKDRLSNIVETAKQNWDDPEMIINDILSKWYIIEWFEQKIKDDIAKKYEQEKSQWLLWKIWDIFSERSWKIWEAFNRDQTWLETAWQTAWNIIWGVTDIALAWAIEWAKIITPDFIENAIVEWWKSAFNSFANTEIWKAWLNALQWWMEIYSEWAKNNPRASANLEAIVDIGSIIPVGKWLQSGKQVLAKWAEIAWKTTLGKKVVKWVENLWKQIAKKTKWVKDVVWYLWDEVLSKTTGLSAKARSFAYKKPDILTKAQKGEITTETTIEGLKRKISSQESKIWDLWSKYKSVRDLDIDIETSQLWKNIGSLLKEWEIQITPKWVLDFRNSAIANDSSQRAIQKAYSTLIGRWNVKPKILLNLRKQLDDLIDYWTDVSTEWQKIIKSMRKEVDNLAKEKIPWLKELDTQYKPLKEEISRLKKDFFNKDWTLKDNVDSKIRNLTAPSNRQRLERVKQIYPEIEDLIDAVKYSDEIVRAWENTVWQYTRWWLIAWWIATWNPALIIWSIATNPNLVISAIKQASKLIDWANNIIKKIRKGEKLTTQEVSTIVKQMPATQKARLLALPPWRATVAPEWWLFQVKAPIKPVPRTKQIVEKPLSSKDEIRWLKTIWDIKKQVPSKELEPLYQEARKYKTAEEFMMADIKNKNKFMSDISTFKRLSELDSQELKRSIWTTDLENIPKEITLYRGIKENNDFNLRPWDFLSKNKKIAQDFAKWWTVKSFKVKSKDLLWDTFWNEEVLYAPESHYKQIREEAKSYWKKTKKYQQKSPNLWDNLSKLPEKPLTKDEIRWLKTIWDIKKQVPSKELEPLYQEARKYKTAEEFLKQMIEGKTNNISDLSAKARSTDKLLKDILNKQKKLEVQRDKIKSKFIELKKKEWRKMKEDASKEGMILDKKYQDLNSQIDVLNMDYKDRRDSIANSYIPSYEWNKIKSHLKQIREEANKTNKK